MAVSSKRNPLFSLVKPFLPLQKYKHSLGENCVMEQEKIDMSKWRKLDSRKLGICRSMISESSWIVLKVLQSAGYDAYLVGGCVRDLILNKVPKDFDIITTAALKQVRKEFHRCLIIGIRFPICRVEIKGSVIEVSSFDTVAKHDKEKELVPIPRGCDKKDYARWRNCMHRDFTVNSLFFDPFESKVYDYANALVDLRSLKLRTLIPAHQSFEEDCARILRGLRLAARLGLSLSQETEMAIQKLVPSIASLSKVRIMMEMNYMLSYGASEPSLSILHKFKLLEMLLPLHAAYLNQQSRNHHSPVMLMKLFSNLDKLVSCGQPSDCNLWVGLLAFHLALVLDPQDPLVVWTFASVLYYGNWNNGVKSGRKKAHRVTFFVPEITYANRSFSDNELAKQVTKLASKVQYYTGCLSRSDDLHKFMVRFPDSLCSGLVFVSLKTQKRASDLFNVLVHNIESYEKERKDYEIDYKLLGQGNIGETRFVLGKIIMDTMSSGVVQDIGDADEKHKLVNSDFSDFKNEDAEEKYKLVISDSETEFNVFGNENKKRGLPPNSAEPEKIPKKKKQRILENCGVSEDGSTVKGNKAVNTEKIKKGNRSILQFVKDGEHPNIKDVKLHAISGAKSKLVKENIKKGSFSLEKNNLALEKNKKRGKFSQNNGSDEGKTEQPEEDLKRDKNRRLSLASILEVKDKGHTKIENMKWQDNSEAKLKPVKEKVKNIIYSAENTNLPLDNNKKREKVSENNRGGEGKTEKPEDVKKEKNKFTSLSSLFRP